MNPDLQLKARLDDVRGRIARAAARSGRPPQAIRLIGVVKTIPVGVIQSAMALGLSDLGENRVQEAEAKIAVLGRDGIRWHMIGHLQRNKSGRAVELFDRIHGVDSLELAQALSTRAAGSGRRLPVLVEVNVSGEASKFGVTPSAVPQMCEFIAGLDGLALDGLMTVGPAVTQPDDARPGFELLRALREDAERRIGRALPELSMGMSGDFEVAIQAGSTMVRVGSAIFGARR